MVGFYCYCFLINHMVKADDYQSLTTIYIALLCFARQVGKVLHIFTSDSCNKPALSTVLHRVSGHERPSLPLIGCGTLQVSTVASERGGVHCFSTKVTLLVNFSELTVLYV